MFGTSTTPLQPLSGLADPTPEASPEQIAGDPADPRHGELGEVSRPYPWEGIAEGPHGPFGMENGLLGGPFPMYLVAGQLRDDPTGDYQPLTRAAPFPKGLPSGLTDPDTEASRLRESVSIHSSDMNGAARNEYAPTLDPNRDNWAFVDRQDAGESLQVPLPKQTQGVSGGWAHRDRTQSGAPQNDYGYDQMHVGRRFAHNSIPGNYMNLQPHSRAMMHPQPSGAKLPTGDFSPFTGDDVGQAFGTHGAVLTEIPPEYSGPIDPALQTPVSDYSTPVPNNPWILQ